MTETVAEQTLLTPTSPANETAQATLRNPYVGPRTFTQADRNWYFGREQEAQNLLALVIAERLTLFYAQSGAGKSSLLNTQLIPALREQARYLVLPVGRVGGELPAGIADVANIYTFNLLLSLDQDKASAPGRFATMPLVDFMAGLRTRDGQHYTYDEATAQRARQNRSNGQPPPRNQPPHVLIIDQFEELVTTHPQRWREREVFFQQLGEAMRADPLLWVVLTLREDFIAPLDPFAHLVPGNLTNRFYMQRMGIDAARLAIQRPAEKAGRPFTDEAARRLVDNLSLVRVAGQEGAFPGQYVEPVQLQVVCYELWENLHEEQAVGEGSGEEKAIGDSALITSADLQRAGDVDTALADFYEQALKNALALPDLPLAERQLRTWFDEQLITDANTRGTVYRGEEETAGMSNRVVDALQARFLLRSEVRAGGIWVELVHDRLIPPIRAANQTWLLNQNNPVTSAAHVWDENKRPKQLLLRGELLDQAQQFAANNIQVLGDLERAYLEASEQQRTAERARRNQYLAATMALAAFIALLGVVYAFRQRTIANAVLVANYAAIEADRKVDTALLLALEAFKIHDSPETRSQLHYATARSYEPELALLTEHTAEVWGVAYSPDGQQIATASQDGSILLWNAETYQVDQRLQAPETNLSYYRLAFSPDGRWLAAGGFGGYLLIWDLQSGQVAYRLKEHTDSIFNLAFSPDGSRLVTGGSDQRVLLWDVATWQAQKLGEHTNWIWDVAFSPDGGLVATAARDKSVQIWDITNPATISNTIILTDHQAIVTSVAFHPSLTTTVLASGDVNGQLILWNLDPWRQTHQRPLHSKPLKKQTGYFWSLAFSPDGSILASTSSRSTLHYWGIDLAQPVTQMNPAPLSSFLRGHNDDLVDIAFNPSGQQVVVASIDGRASVWAVNNGNLLTADAGTVKSMALIENEKTLLTASDAGVVNAWETTAFQTLAWQWKLETSAPITRTILSADGAKLLSATDKRVIQLWDVKTRRAILQIQPISMAAVTTLAISPDQRYIAAGQSDGRINLWRIDNPKQIAGGVLGQQGRVDTLAFSQDGQLLASGGCNLANVEVSAAIGCPGEILVWNTVMRQQKGSALAKLGDNSAFGYAQLGHISALVFSHDHQKLASGSSRGLVTIWDLEQAKVLAENKEHNNQYRIRSLVFSPDDSLLISAGPWGTLDDETGTIILWDVERGVRFGRSFNEHDKQVNALLLHENGLSFYSAGEDGYIIVNNLDTNYWFRRACQIANRKLTSSERQRYLSGRSYGEACPVKR